MNDSILWLLAEDNEDEYLLLKHACSRLRPQPRLHRAKDGLQARAYIAQAGLCGNHSACPLPRLILSDLKMPLMDGLELLGWVKKQWSLQGIPFVLLTCSNIQRDWERACELGADGYLVKPTDSADFRHLLQAVMDVDSKKLWHLSKGRSLTIDGGPSGASMISLGHRTEVLCADDVARRLFFR